MDAGINDFDSSALCPKARELYDYWRSKCTEGRLPARADIDPVEVHRLMSVMYLIDVVQSDNKPRLCIRLSGTEIVNYLGRDAKGLWMDEDEVMQKVLPDFVAVVEDRMPRYTSNIEYGKKEHITYNRLILPLANDGDTVDMLIGVMCFDKAVSVKKSI